VSTALLAIGLLVGSSMGAAGSASAASDRTGLWYYDTFHVQAAHDAGWTGKGVTIAVIDDGINLAVPTLAGADIVTHPAPTCRNAAGKVTSFSAVNTSLNASHGTNVVSMIVGSGKGYSADQQGVVGVAPGARILFYSPAPPVPDNKLAVCDGKNGEDATATNMANEIIDAVDSGASIITTSIVGTENPAATRALAFAENRGVVVLGALPDGLDISNLWPAGANGVISVQAVGADGAVILPGPGVDVAGPGIGILTQGDAKTGLWSTQDISDGTSFATPIIAGFLAMVKQKYPSATGSQLIQTLIRNTGSTDHPLGYDSKDSIGYGIASVTHMLAVDPTKYSDVNPLVAKTLTYGPSAAQIAAATSPVRSSTPEAAAAAKPSASTGWLVPTIIAVVVVLLVVAGIVVLVVLAMRRTRRRAKRPLA
jgi:subtilisin family serine protease